MSVPGVLQKQSPASPRDTAHRPAAHAAVAESWRESSVKWREPVHWTIVM